MNPLPIVWLILLGLGMLLAFITAFARSAAYLDRDAYDELLARFDSHSREAVAQFTKDPLAVQFAADAFAALLLVGLVAAAFALAGHAAAWWGIDERIVQVVFALVV